MVRKQTFLKEKIGKKYFTEENIWIAKRTQKDVQNL